MFEREKIEKKWKMTKSTPEVETQPVAGLHCSTCYTLPESITINILFELLCFMNIKTTKKRSERER